MFFINVFISLLAALSQFLTLQPGFLLPGSKSKSRSVSHESGAPLGHVFRSNISVASPGVLLIGWSRYTIEGKGQRSRFPGVTVFFFLCLFGDVIFFFGQRFKTHEKK